MSNAKKNVGTQILDYLRAKGKKARKAGVASTQEVADAIGVPVKQVYDRMYWLAQREGVLVKSGSGKAATWRTTPKARAAKAPKQAETASQPEAGNDASDASEGV